MANNDISVAERLVAISRRTKDDFFKANVASVVKRLAGTGLSADSLPVKRFTFGSDMAELVSSTHDAADADFFQHIPQLSLPFPRFWIEGDSYNADYLLQGREWRETFDMRRGFYCEKQGDDIHVTSFVENPGNVAALGQAANPDYLFQGRLIAGRRRHILGRAGVQSLEKYEDLMHAVQKSGYGLASEAQEQNVRHGIQVSEAWVRFLARTIVLMTSARVAPQAWREEAPEDTARRVVEYRENLVRGRRNQPPILRTAPLTVDITHLSLAGRVKGPKAFHELLGWTSVAQSRPWRCKKTGELRRNRITGELIYTRPHDRKIRAPEDRRGATRKLKAGAMATVDVAADYPTLTIGQPADKPTQG